ncbi:MAG: S-methyl-5-thioribose-1-phosphate isomerase [Candidatus Thermoplasmatota archaeon]|nr:S-methyl-5-thioribose-1-phosphate isomerase [Euryarchaeota archaeon]MBU4032517.1 S-methyl-5-thioribose-1-phosphate isomerase [Candidatus Thermoplasmatota archaeon]MBU4071226.1 S-methyl-5-thioribose-1-phosphate isomerase [Candidatus Thermoplasmatota archaeon]MBU4143979.1 S-methyl-5-thioribose-1-phosphate isomerase [Candidatus Thermoplasmatota archaeon]MBU4591412.1 S-methyl-5-thioribose-1-phosphate isomerase [Candidatus Thermoplasmatota archaeon]
MKVRCDGRDMDTRALWMDGDVVKFIDQKILPHRFEILGASTVEEVAIFIEDMTVRGAPSIGAAGAYGMAVAQITGMDIQEAALRLKRTRPTAFDLFYGVDSMLAAASQGRDLVAAAEEYVTGIAEKCRKIGEHGNALIKDGFRILTHCNAGALATIDYGTALSPIRAAHRAGKKIHVFADETRPRLQGAALTSWELVQEGIPHDIIPDNAAGHFMQRGEIDMVIVGADRIAANGDFANKIGTYEKAVCAKENEIPFYTAAPVSTFDFSLESGMDIPIEERGQDEVRYVNGKLICPEKATARNPAFDMTPARYVTGIITEAGIFRPGELEREKLQ